MIDADERIAITHTAILQRQSWREWNDATPSAERKGSHRSLKAIAQPCVGWAGGCSGGVGGRWRSSVMN